MPHLARLCVGNQHKYLIPTTALCGAIIVLVADTIGRTLMAPYEISAGIIMSMIGGPIFILLLKGVYMKVNHLSFSYNHQSYMKDINIQFKDQK